MDWQGLTFWPALRTAFHQLIRTPPDTRDMGAVAQAAKAGGEALRILDAWLADKRFVGGDNLTMGDIPAGTLVYRWFALDIERPDLPHLRNWYDRLSQRPGYREHVLIPMDGGPDACRP